MSSIDPDDAGKWVGYGLAAAIAAAKVLRDRWDRSPPAERAKKLTAATVDVGKVLLDHDKAHLEELDNLRADHADAIEQYEVRELNLTAANTELLRQAAEAAKTHALSLQQIIADREADRAELHRLNEGMRALDAKIDESKKLHEACEQRLLHLQAGYQHRINENDSAIRALQHGRSAQDEKIARLEGELEDAHRRGYRAAKKVDEATGGQGAFRATDVFPEGKPRP